VQSSNELEGKNAAPSDKGADSSRSTAESLQSSRDDREPAISEHTHLRTIKLRSTSRCGSLRGTRLRLSCTLECTDSHPLGSSTAQRILNLLSRGSCGTSYSVTLAGSALMWAAPELRRRLEPPGARLRRAHAKGRENESAHIRILISTPAKLANHSAQGSVKSTTRSTSSMSRSTAARHFLFCG
jgi:hypothetical protein